MSRRFLTLCVLLALVVTAPTAAAEKAPLIPANELLLGHSNFFQPVQVYDLQKTAGCDQRLAPLNYKAYSAVSFNLANMIALVGPDNGLVIVDTLGSDASAKVALEAIRGKTSPFPKGPKGWVQAGGLELGNVIAPGWSRASEVARSR